MIRETLRNGMTILVRANRLSPAVSVRLCMHSGAIQDPPGLEGTATVTSSLLEEGTKSRKGHEIAEFIDFLGAETDCLVDKHSTVLLASMLRENLGDLLRLMRDQVTEPAFPAKEISKITGQILTGLREDEHDTRAVAQKALRRFLYGRRHPYRRPTSGTKRSIKAIRRGDLVKFHREHYHPCGSILVVVGDVDEEKTVRLVKRIFGRWKKEGDPSPPPVPVAKTPRRISVSTKVVPDKTQSDIAFGYVGIRRNDPDFYSAMVMNQIFGSFGLGGRLGNRIREEEGLAYYVGSGMRPGVGEGPFTVAAGVHPDHVAHALSLTLEEVDRIRQKKVTVKELDETRSFLVDSLPLRLETNAGIAAFMLNEEYFGLGPDYLRRYPALVGAVGADEVLSAAQRLLSSEAYSVAIAGPPLPGAVEDALNKAATTA